MEGFQVRWFQVNDLKLQGPVISQPFFRGELLVLGRVYQIGDCYHPNGQRLDSETQTFLQILKMKSSFFDAEIWRAFFLNKNIKQQACRHGYLVAHGW